MADTKKLVHWASDVSASEMGSPSSDTSAASFASTPNMQYINSQLIAHGFTTTPGLSLEGISSTDSERVVKCILAMLSQRVNDMSRAEDLTTKLRTLSYDHERLTNMHSASKEKLINAEKDVNLYKSRLATATRAIQTSEANHKQATAELQRTRSSLQGLRATHVSELKKKEREIERMVEKWNKLVEVQAKVSAASTGICFRGGNAEVASDSAGKSKGYLEVALEHAEASRAELFAESTRLRRLVLTCANRIQSLAHRIRLAASIQEEEPPSMDHDALFPLAPINAPEEKLLTLFSSANDALAVLSKHFTEKSSPSQNLTGNPAGISDANERANLQNKVTMLQTELDELKLRHKSQSIEVQSLHDQIAEQTRSRCKSDLVPDIILAPERERLERIKKELDDERAEVAEAIVKLCDEKAALEGERVKFLEEKRNWQERQRLVETSDTPQLDVDASESLLKKSPRKSPRKQKTVGKLGSGRKTRMSRRSSVFSIPPPTRVEPAYETELIPILVQSSASQSQPHGRQSILPTSFVLPPPSPRTSLPPPPHTLLEPFSNHSPIEQTSTGGSVDITPSIQSSQSPDSSTSLTVEEPASALQSNSGLVPPHTPVVGRRPFPMAKPLAPHMTHAYSPAKPSPLSRILMLADSPDSTESIPLPTTVTTDIPPTNLFEPLAREDDDDDEESPLREKRTERNVDSQRGVAKKVLLKTKAKVHPPPVAAAANGKSKMSGSLEKENRSKSMRRVSPTNAPQPKPPTNVNATKGECPVKNVTKAPSKLPTGKGGARRVPVGSAEAAPGWKA
ncbi:hypothetical protein ID866_2626 [Astraeus odoratus]|nr:hypothetical protein ID866_2626 [Astraeus odoratus]